MGPSCSILTTKEQNELPTFYSSYRNVDIYFESDSFEEHRGFLMDFKATKGNLKKIIYSNFIFR